MDDYTKYDYILAAIGVALCVVLTGFVFSPSIIFIAALAGAALIFYAMFVIPPTQTERFI